MTRAFALLLLSAAAGTAANPDPKSLVVPADVTARAAELVAKLDDRDFHDRDDATRELRKLGRLALPTLQDALARNTHPEVRLRVEILLPAATSAEMRARVECFLADADGKFQHDLPGAKPFFAAVGRSEVSKQLFSDMIRSANRDLIVAVEGPENDLRQKYTDRRADLNVPVTSGVVIRGDQTNTMNVIDMCALLFAEARLPDRGNVVGVGAARVLPLVSNYQFQTALQNALSNDPRKDALSAVLKHWMETRDQAYSIYTAINFMNRFSLPHALPAARKLAAGKVAGGGPGVYRGYAITYLARFGTADDLPTLEGLFEDKTVLTTVFLGGGPGGNRQQRVQVRDLALAMALTVTKQKLTDYGVSYRYASSGGASDTLKYNISAYHFEADDEEKTDEKRDAAVKKYAEWKAAEKKKEPEKKDDKKEPGK